jgi:hypothetical protein
MADSSNEIPEWIEEQIDLHAGKVVTNKQILEIIQEAKRPFVPVSYVAGRTEIQSDGMRPRLNRLEDVGVLASCPGANGDVYWIKDDRSDWPIPPDVEVEPVENEMTVSEVWERKYVQLAVIGGLFSAAATVLLTVFLTISLAEVPFLVEVQSAFVVVAFTFALFASVAFVFSGFVFAQRRFGSGL